MKLSRIGCTIFDAKIYEDRRGHFAEVFKKSAYPELPEFVQDNFSFSKENVIRGLHFQIKNPQGKLVRVLHGRVIDVAVDLRKGSPTFGRSESFDLKAEGMAVYIPPGYAHGFWALRDTIFLYKCTKEYDAELDGGISLWSKGLELPWSPYKDDPPGESPLLISEKDLALPEFDKFDSPFTVNG